MPPVILGYDPITKQPIYEGPNGEATYDLPPEPGSTAAPTPAPAPVAPAPLPEVQQGLSRLGMGGGGGALSTEQMIDQLLQAVIGQQFPTRMAGLLGAIPGAQAQAAGSPMAVSRAMAPQLSGLQRNIQQALKKNSMQFGPAGGGMLNLGREAGLLPIQQQAAGLPGQVRKQGQNTLLDIATNTSILNPSAARSSSSSGKMTQENTPYDFSGWNMLGAGLGKLFGSPYGTNTLGGSAWDWMSNLFSSPAAPTTGGVNTAGMGMSPIDQSSMGGW